MRSRKDRRKPIDSAAAPFEDVSRNGPERRKLHDRRMENLNAEERQLLFSEMPGTASVKTTGKN